MKLPFWATTFTVLGVSVLLSLSCWQFVRLEWKNNLIVALEKEYRVDASKIPLRQKDFSGGTLFRRGFVEGRFTSGSMIFLVPRVSDAKVGGHILMSFQPDGYDSPVLVNRGWAPSRDEALKCTGSDLQHVRLIGVMRRPLRDNVFVPHNNPEKAEWYRMDMPQIAAYTKNALLQDRVLYVESQSPDRPCLMSASGQIKIPNNHLQYALFWLGMASVLVIVYFLRIIRKQDASLSNVDESS